MVYHFWIFTGKTNFPSLIQVRLDFYCFASAHMMIFSHLAWTENISDQNESKFPFTRIHKWQKSYAFLCLAILLISKTHYYQSKAYLFKSAYTLTNGKLFEICFFLLLLLKVIVFYRVSLVNSFLLYYVMERSLKSIYSLIFCAPKSNGFLCIMRVLCHNGYYKRWKSLYWIIVWQSTIHPMLAKSFNMNVLLCSTLFIVSSKKKKFLLFLRSINHRHGFFMCNE